MKRISGVIGAYGSHCRNIDVFYHNTKTIYEIPLYGERLFKYTDFYLDKHYLKITLSQEPIQHHLEVSSCDNQITEKVQLAETDKYSVSHQLVYREMK
jgi:hypothetical protein